MTSDDDLADRLRTGDEAALGELFDRHRVRLRQTVHFRMNPRMRQRVDVDDILQEAFLDAKKRLPHYADAPAGSSAYVWLRLMTLQTLADVHRRHFGVQARSVNREAFSFDGAGSTTAESMAYAVVGSVTPPEGRLDRNESLAEVRAALERMKPLDQEVLALRHFEELSNGEVAEILKLAPGAASNRYVRALQRLQRLIGQVPTITPRDMPRGQG